MKTKWFAVSLAVSIVLSPAYAAELVSPMSLAPPVVDDLGLLSNEPLTSALLSDRGLAFSITSEYVQGSAPLVLGGARWPGPWTRIPDNNKGAVNEGHVGEPTIFYLPAFYANLANEPAFGEGWFDGWPAENLPDLNWEIRSWGR